jgi:hypothetical protein
MTVVVLGATFPVGTGGFKLSAISLAEALMLILARGMVSVLMIGLGSEVPGSIRSRGFFAALGNNFADISFNLAKNFNTSTPKYKPDSVVIFSLMPRIHKHNFTRFGRSWIGDRG